MRRIAALVPNVPGVAAGQRVRIETWAGRLEEWGWTVDLHPFEDEALHRVLYRPGEALAKARHLASCYAGQLERIRRGRPCDVLFVYQEAALVGPALLERLAVRRLGAPLVYDLDDPRFLAYRSPTSGWASLLKFSGKTRSLIRMADHVIAINRLLAGYAGRHARAVTVVPNAVDVDRYRPADPPEGPPRLVWIGSHSTAANLHHVAPALRRLQAHSQAPLRVVGASPFHLEGVDVEVRQWSAATEIAELQECHVGLVPVLDTPWNRWKFFFKTVQYMAAGLPVVASRMGSNPEVVDEGVNGFLVDTPDEWYHRLRQLVENPDLRRRMGAAARATVVERYSLQVQMGNVASVFDRVADGRRSHARGVGDPASGRG